LAKLRWECATAEESGTDIRGAFFSIITWLRHALATNGRVARIQSAFDVIVAVAERECNVLAAKCRCNARVNSALIAIVAGNRSPTASLLI
jgi:hypothetical protein